MSVLVTFIGEIPLRIGNEIVFVNAWSYESVFGAGDDNLAYRDTAKSVRINPRLLLEDFDAVVVRVTKLGAGKWSQDQVTHALQPALDNLIGHFEIERQALGTIVRLSKGQRHRLRQRRDPNAGLEIRIFNEGLDDLAVQNGAEQSDLAREHLERSAMVQLANHVSRVLS